MNDAISLEKVPVVHAQVASRVYDGQAVIILADEGEATILNESGTLLWTRIDGNRRVKELSETLAEHYGIPAEEAQADSVDFLNSLLDAKAIEIKD